MLSTMGTASKTATAVIIGICAIALAGCSSPSYESVASDCGGRSAGVLADETAIVVEKTSDALICVVDRLVPNEADQTVIADNLWGGETRVEAGGYEVTFVSIGGDDFVSISRGD